jgi:hypothetical protein
VSVRIRDRIDEGLSREGHEVRSIDKRRRRRAQPRGVSTSIYHDKSDPYPEGFIAGKAGALVEAMPGRFKRDAEQAELWKMGWAEGHEERNTNP